MNAMQSETIKLAAPSAIHVGPIVTGSSNETISIVIPLSAQVATVAGLASGLDSRKGACNDCGKDFPSVPESNGRNRAQGNAKGCPFPTCSRYGRAFSRAHDLKRHLARHEAKKEKLSDTVNVRVHRCTICTQHFLSEASFQKHVASHESTPPPVEHQEVVSRICALCGLSFVEAGGLQDHMKTHTTDNSETLFVSQDEKSSAYVEEMKSTEYVLSTTILSKNEMTPNSVAPIVPVTSLDTTTNSNKIRCDYCWKTFKSKWTLNSHVAAHEGRFQFDCDQCGKRFVRKSHFEGHMRSHEATRPYTCEICRHTFKQAKHRREHMKRKHPGSQNAVQNLFDSISACVSEESSVDQPEFTLLTPVEFTA